MYLDLQGKVYLGRLVNGVPTGIRWVNNVPSFKVNFQTNVTNHYESYTGSNLSDYRKRTQNQANLEIQLEDASTANLALALYGTSITKNAGSVTNEVQPAGMAVGDAIILKKTQISAVVVRDSAGSPATLVAGTHYRIESAGGGVLMLLNVAGFTQPFKVDYSYALQTNLTMFADPGTDYYVMLDGFNRADNNKAVRCELWRWSYDPGQLDLISKGDIATFPLSGSCLADSTKASDPELGSFGRLLMVS